MAVKGHLVWTLQRATGMRGDDLRSMHLAALQPYSMTLPNDFSNREVDALVLPQWNHKAVHTTNVSSVVWSTTSEEEFDVLSVGFPFCIFPSVGRAS
jgi:hypothetical protein